MAQNEGSCALVTNMKLDYISKKTQLPLEWSERVVFTSQDCTMSTKMSSNYISMHVISYGHSVCYLLSTTRGRDGRPE